MNAIERIKMVKAMEFICRNMNDEEAFEGAEHYHTHVCDWATYERALELLRTTDEPTLVFDVTMQNHSGYDTGSIPADQLRGYQIDGLDEDDTFELNEFLACIDESDRALRRLVEELRTLGEPTVLVMYGDHHPWLSQPLNDLLFPDEDELAQMNAEERQVASDALGNWFSGWQPRLSKVFDQLAVNTGVGLRYDLGFLVVRVDWGLALHLPYDTGRSGYFNIRHFGDAQALHFAIGYPF